MKGLIIPSLLFFIAFSSCIPPDTVRLQDYFGRPADGFFARIPTCLIEGDFYLGDTLGETLEKTSNFESDDFVINCEGIKRKSWVILPSDTLVTCTFNKVRLIGLESETIIHHSVSNWADACDALQNAYSCLGELGKFLDQKRLNTYKREEEVFTESYSFKRGADGSSKLNYSICYNSEIQAFYSKNKS